MIIEKNGCNIPDYLDVDFFRNALSSLIDSNDFEIQSLDFWMGSSGGENYLSFIYRVRVSYIQSKSIQKDVNFIVKSIPLDGAKEIFVDMDIYEKEREIYLNIMPRLEDCLGGVKITPRCYYSQANPIATLVFEDMKTLGHDVADRIAGLDENHCKVFLRKLAQYHAGGMILLEKDPSLKSAKLLRHGLISSVSFHPDLWEGYLNDTLIRLVEHASKWPGYESIVKKLEANRLNRKFAEKIIHTMRIAEDDILTIVHGDCWVNNLLFKYNDSRESPTDVVLVDFQGSTIGSIGLDVNYFLYSSLQLDVFTGERDVLVESAYYPALRAELEKAGFKPIPTLGDVKNEIEKKAFYGFMSSMLVLPFISMKKEDSANSNFETLNDENVAKRLKDSACSSPRFLDTMKILLKDYEGTLLRDL